MTESSARGFDLQIGVETDVTAGVEVGDEEGSVSGSISATIPPPFQRAWGDSSNMQSMEKIFSTEQGLVSTTMGICVVYVMSIDTYYVPPFKPAFKKALIELYKASKLDKVKQKQEFIKFTDQYGTHFLIKAKMGAQYMLETKYSRKVRKEMNWSTLKSCNYVSGSKVFGIQVEENSNKCSSSDLEKLKKYGRENVEQVVITKGSRPTDIEKWATQDFTPVPLQFQLSPIVNLLKDSYIKEANLSVDGQKITRSLDIRKWFVPLYYKYCEVKGIDCKTKSGCGIDDWCPVDTICKKGGSIHNCTGKIFTSSAVVFLRIH